jgi:hypothetical protein
MSERAQNSWCFLPIYKPENHKIDTLATGRIVERIGAIEGKRYEKRDHDPGDRIDRF